MPSRRVFALLALLLTTAWSAQAAKTCTLGWGGSPRLLTGKHEATTLGQTLQQCIDACVKSSSCVAFRWVPSTTAGSCTTYVFIDLKFTLIYLNTDPANAVPLDRPIGGRCGVQGPQITGAFGYLNESFMSEQVSSAELCSYSCENYRDLGCQAYTWTEEGGGMCYYMVARTPSVFGPFNGSAMSGEILDCRTQFDVEIIGADLAQVKFRPDWRACWGECRRMSGCMASTWSKENGGTCWLKKTYANKALRKGAVTNSANPSRGAYAYPLGW